MDFMSATMPTLLSALPIAVPAAYRPFKMADLPRPFLKLLQECESAKTQAPAPTT